VQGGAIGVGSDGGERIPVAGDPDTVGRSAVGAANQKVGDKRSQC